MSGRALERFAACCVGAGERDKCTILIPRRSLKHLNYTRADYVPGQSQMTPITQSPELGRTQVDGPRSSLLRPFGLRFIEFELTRATPRRHLEKGGLMLCSPHPRRHPASSALRCKLYPTFSPFLHSQFPLPPSLHHALLTPFARLRRARSFSHRRPCAPRRGCCCCASFSDVHCENRTHLIPLF